MRSSIPNGDATSLAHTARLGERRLQLDITQKRPEISATHLVAVILAWRTCVATTIRMDANGPVVTERGDCYEADDSRREFTPTLWWPR